MTNIKTLSPQRMFKKHYLLDAWFPFRYSFMLQKGCAWNCLYCPGFREGEKQIHNFHWKPEQIKEQINSLPPRQLIGLGGGIGEVFNRDNAQLSLVLNILGSLSEAGQKTVILSKGIDIEGFLNLFHRRNEKPIFLMSFSSLDDATASILEPGTPAPGKRIQALKKLKATGFDIGLIFLPLLPGVNTGETELDLALEMSQKIEARWVLARTGSMDSLESVFRRAEGLIRGQPEPNQYQDQCAEIEERWSKSIMDKGFSYVFPREWYWEYLSKKDRVVVMLSQLYWLQKNLGKSRDAYQRAAYGLNKLSEDEFEKWFRGNKLIKVPGIGPFIEKLILSVLKQKDFSFYDSFLT